MVASILNQYFSNANCDNMVGFPKSGHIICIYIYNMHNKLINMSYDIYYYKYTTNVSIASQLV